MKIKLIRLSEIEKHGCPYCGNKKIADYDYDQQTGIILMRCAASNCMKPFIGIADFFLKLPIGIPGLDKNGKPRRFYPTPEKHPLAS